MESISEISRTTNCQEPEKNSEQISQNMERLREIQLSEESTNKFTIDYGKYCSYSVGWILLPVKRLRIDNFPFLSYPF